MSETKSSIPVLSDRAYGILKFIAQIVLPALGTFYFALSQIWGIPKGAEVVGTITAVDAFLGVVLGLSTMAYMSSGARFAGSIDIVEQEDDVKLYSLDLKSDPTNLDTKKEVTFKVNPTVKKVKR